MQPITHNSQVSDSPTAPANDTLATGRELPASDAQLTKQTDAAKEFDKFVSTIAALRAPDGCPWDREQTHASIAKNLIEEAYEAVAAIEEDDVEHMREELGDVLLQVVLQSQIAFDDEEFNIADVIRDVNAKMIRRHPHVFGTQAAFEAAGLDPAKAESSDDVLNLWDQIKVHERKLKEEARLRSRLQDGLPADMPVSLLHDVPRMQPALMQAQEISKKAVKAGFEWETEAEVWAKVNEEVAEFQACQPGSAEARMEFGDVLFTLVNVARKQGIDAESALRETCDKFRTRWSSMELEAYHRGVDVATLPIDEQEALWQLAKEKEK